MTARALLAPHACQWPCELTSRPRQGGQVAVGYIPNATCVRQQFGQGAAQCRCSHQHSRVGVPTANGQTPAAQRSPACPSSDAKTPGGRRIVDKPARHAPWPRRVFARKPPPPLLTARPLPRPPGRACTGELPSEKRLDHADLSKQAIEAPCHPRKMSPRTR